MSSHVRRRVTDSDIEKALRASGGIVSEAARRVGLSRRQVYRRLEQSRKLNELRNELRESLLDACEAVVIHAALDGVVPSRSANAVRELEPRQQVYWAAWLLERIGRHRGYVPPGGTGHVGMPDGPQSELQALERLSAAIQVAVTSERHARARNDASDDT